MSLELRCDREGCHARTRVERADEVPTGWTRLTVRPMLAEQPETFHACAPGCLEALVVEVYA